MAGTTLVLKEENLVVLENVEKSVFFGREKVSKKSWEKVLTKGNCRAILKKLSGATRARRKP